SPGASNENDEVDDATLRVGAHVHRVRAGRSGPDSRARGRRSVGGASRSNRRSRRPARRSRRHLGGGDARRARLIAHLEAHGLMDLESSRPMDEEAIFRIASMSKPVGAVAILMLIEEGKVRL